MPRTQRDAHPPPAPALPRQVRLSKAQAFGVFALSLLPILAAFDAFGTREETVEASGPELKLRVEYEPRVRYGSPTRIQIDVQDSRGEGAAPLEVRVDSGLLERFMQLTMTPSPSRIADGSHVFVLAPSSAEHRILIELEPERYGKSTGRVSISPIRGGATAEVALSIFSYP